MKGTTLITSTVIAILLISCGSGKTEIGELTSITAQERTIQVIGSADMEVVPDLIEFRIGIEERNTGKSLAEIEKDLRAKLGELGITSDQITTYDVGHYWNYQYDDRKLSKDFSLQLSSMDQVDEILAKINMKGIGYMSIGELQHKDLQEYRKDVKMEALEQAKVKASYLLESQGYDLGDLISIKEMGNGYNWWYGGAALGNATIYQPGNNSTGGSNNPRNISLSYEVEVIYGIK